MHIQQGQKSQHHPEATTKKYIYIYMRKPFGRNVFFTRLTQTLVAFARSGRGRVCGSAAGTRRRRVRC